MLGVSYSAMFTFGKAHHPLHVVVVSPYILQEYSSILGKGTSHHQARSRDFFDWFSVCRISCTYAYTK